MLPRLVITVLLLGLSVVIEAQTCNDNISASTPDERFTVNDDKVIDNKTGLIWKRCLEGQTGPDCAGTPTLFNWQQALRHAAEQTDWRLPNINELRSIVELRCCDPAINLSLFPNTSIYSVWSGSPIANYSYHAWSVYFGSGYDGYSFRSYNLHVRLVRGGQ